MLGGPVKSLKELKIKLSSVHLTCECQWIYLNRDVERYETIVTLWVRSGEG